MQPIITSNDISINIKYIDDKESHYQLNIPNNDINKKLIENTVFKFEKCGSVIIMHDDNNVFQLSKMECSYSDYIEIKKQLENMKKENDILNIKITDKNQLQQQINIYYEEQIDQLKKETDNLKKELMDIKTLLHQQIKLSNDKSVVDTKVKIQLNNNLHQQIKEINYYLPFVFKCGNNPDITHYGNEQIVAFSQDRYPEYGPFFNSQKDVKITQNLLGPQIYRHIIIPPGKVLITLPTKEYSLKVYNKGNHYNIKLGDITMFINEKNISNIIDLYKKEQAVKIFGNLSIIHIESECIKW
jgi:hypothetical protein